MPVSRKNKSMKKSSKTHKRKNVMKGGEGEEYEMTNMTSMSNTPYQVLTNQNMYNKRILKKRNKKNEENEKSLKKSSQKSMLNNRTMLYNNNNNNYMSSLSERVKILKKKNKEEYGENYLNKQNRINKQRDNERLIMEEQQRLKMEEQQRLKMKEQKIMDNEKERIAEEQKIMDNEKERIAEERRRIAQLRKLQNEQEQERVGKLSFKERIEYDRRKQEDYRVKMERIASSKSLIGSSTGKSKSSGLSHTERRSS